MHYGRYTRWGDPNKSLKKVSTSGIVGSPEIHSEDSGDCRVWVGAAVGNGYGQIRVNSKTRLAHRVAYEQVHGEIPDGLVIDHTCHNRACIKVEHLRAVTQKQNLENNGTPNRNSKSGVRGVHWDKQARKYVAKVFHEGKTYYVGSFDCLEKAEVAVIAKRNELFTHNDKDRLKTRSAK